MFHTDPSFRSHLAQERWERRSFFDNGDMWKGLARKVACPHCKAPPGEPCVSLSKAKPGAALPSLHSQRFSEAKQKFGRKR